MVEYIDAGGLTLYGAGTPKSSASALGLLPHSVQRSEDTGAPDAQRVTTKGTRWCVLCPGHVTDLTPTNGIKAVALSGGVFQNRLLFRLAVDGLREEGFEVLTHRLVPCNDGGISLGQAAIANFAVD